MVERKALYANLESALAQIRRYIMSKSDVPTPIYAALHSHEDFVDSGFFKQRKKQSNLTDFFFLRHNVIFLNSLQFAKLTRYLYRYCTYFLGMIKVNQYQSLLI